MGEARPSKNPYQSMTTFSSRLSPLRKGNICPLPRNRTAIILGQAS